MFYRSAKFFFYLLMNRWITLVTVLFLGLFISFLFTLGFSKLDDPFSHLPSIFLITVFFIGQFLLMETHQKFEQEKTLQSVILSGIDPMHVYFSILCVFFSFLLSMGICIWLLLSLFFQVPLMLNFSILGIMGLGILAYTCLGILIYAFHVFAKVGFTFLIVLFFPLLIPIFMITHQALSDIVLYDQTSLWHYLVGLNLLFVFSCALLYETLAEELI